MGRVLTNNVSLSYTLETSLGVAGTVWFLLEPNNLNRYGAEINTVSRNPISRNRQRRKGLVTDLDSAVEFPEDLTLSSFRDFISAFCFVADGINTDVTDLAATACDTTLDDYTGLTALTAAQADKMEIDTLLWVTGGSNAANNGLKVVDADIASSATTITVVENLVTETAAFKLSLAGHRIATGDVVTWTWDSGSNQATLNLTGAVAALQALGLTVGQEVHIGSIAAAGDTTVVNAFENSVANDMFGYARVFSFSGADDVIFDKVAAALQFTDGTDPATAVDVMFGEFFRNVATDDAEFLEKSFQFELDAPNLDTGGNAKFQYSLGNFCNTAQFTMPLTDKATVTYGFIGTDTEKFVAAGSRKSGASSATIPLRTTAFNTSSDIARLRIQDTDDNGLGTCFKSLTLTIDNNVSPEKALATLGAKFLNTGNFDINLESQLILLDSALKDAVRDNDTVTMDFILKNDEGVIVVDVPSMTLGGGNMDFPLNETVLVNLTGEAFLDATFNTSVGFSLIPVPLPTSES